MNEVINFSENSREYEAARQLLSIIEASWTPITNSTERLTICCSAQCYGQADVRDIDILLLFRAETPRRIMLPSRSGVQHLPRDIRVESLCIAIEVKDHDANGLRITGNGEVDVHYRDGWSSASEQNRKQKTAVRDFLARKNVRSPFVVNVLWLRGIADASLPTQPNNLVGADANWGRFVEAVLSQAQVKFNRGFNVLRAADRTATIDIVRQIFTQNVTPTTLDRRKLEALVREHAGLEVQRAQGGTQVIYRGRGGTGKTICLLHFAYDRYLRAGERTLLLTYNLALVADFVRLLCILKVRDRCGERSIRVDTLHSLVIEVAAIAGVLKKDEDTIKNYAQIKTDLLKAISNADMRTLVLEECNALSWDHVCIDEAQDCPDDERQLIHLIFGPERCVVADGIDQMIRQEAPCDWRAGVAPSQTKTISLATSMRLQQNLCIFANAMAAELALDDWRIEPNPNLPGGRIIVVHSPTGFPDKAMFKSLSEYNQSAGNEPLDMLFCVPPNLIRHDPIRACLPALNFVENGLRVWDGTNPNVRSMPALENDSHRFVQYESCRGLEGWIVFLHAFDEFFELKRKQFLNEVRQDSAESQRLAFLRAAEWQMIPMTRAINTLVINVTSKTSTVSKALERVSERFPDYVEWKNSPR